MFIHGKTNQKYYSINEKYKYYNNIVKGKITNVSAKTKRKAKLRLKTLTKLKNRDYTEPTLVIVNDNKFGNGISKPRLCVVIDKDDKGRVFVVSTEKRTTKNLILDKNINYQTSNSKKWVNKDELYETKYISTAKPLTKNDKIKIKSILRKK